ncbi:MAG: FtsW/RodA/SpoVE family cell cycle protein, partial [Actinobacteria bacterium]|nr:FtsW/RodA/SpoVE family cell cycle protein [Actinomycetota bacterium]
MTVLTRIREVAVVRRDNKFDRILFATMLALSGFGLLMIYSATRDSGTFSMERQMIFVAAGLIIYLVVSNIDYREYRGIVPMISVVTLLLLLAVFVFDSVNNVSRWIPLGSFNLQPAEFAKVVVIVVLASHLAPSRRDELGPRTMSWQKVLQAVGIVAVPAALVYMQPDLGTTLVFGFILFAMLFISGATWRQLVSLLVALVLAVAAALQFGLLSQY